MPTIETLPDGTEAVRVECVKFNTSKVQVWTCSWTSEDRVIRFKGNCVVCGTRTYAADTGGNDPRGVLGRHTADIKRAKEFEKCGPDVIACSLCGDDYDRYQVLMRIANEMWRDLPPTIEIDLSEFKIDPEAFWDVSRTLGGDGYDVMDDASKRKWVAVSGWGRDGWDFLEWPYYVGYVRNTAEGYELATNCEGDVSVWRFPTREARQEAMDDLAFWNWQKDGESWVEGIYPDERPDYLRGPYSNERTA